MGDFVRIDLGDGWVTVARVLTEGTFAFYDCRMPSENVSAITVESVQRQSVLFQIAVMTYAIKTGRWKVIGNAPLEDALKRPKPKFIQDALHPELFSIYEDGRMRPAAKSECVGLERAAAWDPEHVEERLRDHYAGRPNKWVLRMALPA